ncbi:MAG: hypothetical protein ACR2PF_01670 [Rhizobiaceae bacterium]
MTREKAIEQLLELAFFHQIYFEPPTYSGSLFPHSEEPFKVFRFDVRHALKEARASMAAVSDEDLKSTAQTWSSPDTQISKEADANRWALINASRELPLPSTLAGGFDADGVEVDYWYWLHMSGWDFYQATALSFGVEPEPWSEFEDYRHIAADVVCDCADKRMRVLRSRLFPTNDITIAPLEFCTWSVKHKMLLPKELLQALDDVEGTNLTEVAFEGAEVNEKVKAVEEVIAKQEVKAKQGEIAKQDVKTKQEKSAKLKTNGKQRLEAKHKPALETRERKSLLKLVIGMAVQHYKFDQKSERPGVAYAIQNDLDQLGLKLSEDTIRKYLAEGKKLLPAPSKDETEK